MTVAEVIGRCRSEVTASFTVGTAQVPGRLVSLTGGPVTDSCGSHRQFLPARSGIRRHGPRRTVPERQGIIAVPAHTVHPTRPTAPGMDGAAGGWVLGRLLE